MSCYELFLLIGRIFRECFHSQQAEVQQALQRPLIQMSVLRFNQEKRQTMSQQTKQTNPSRVELKQMGRRQAISVKQSLQPVDNQDEFYSMNSSQFLQTERIIRSSQNQRPQLQRHPQQTTKKRKSDSRTSTLEEWSDTPVVYKFKIQDQMLQVKDWFKKQYGRAKSTNFRISHAIRLKMQGHGMLTLLSHKLEDFKINFLEDSKDLQAVLFNSQKTFIFRHFAEQVGEKNFRRNKVRKYFQIKSHSATLQQLIEACTSRQAMKLFHDFNDIQAVYNQQGKLRSQLPILEVRQTVRKSEQRLFHLATQLSGCGGSAYQQNQLLLTFYRLDESEQSWNCIIRVIVGVASQVEIMTESFQNFEPKSYSQWRKSYNFIQKYLQRLKIISVFAKQQT